MLDVVSHEARESHSEPRVLKPRGERIGRRPGRRCGLPEAPFERRTLPDLRIGISQQPIVSLHDVSVSLGVG